jgi:hypothetical protein
MHQAGRSEYIEIFRFRDALFPETEAAETISYPGVAILLGMVSTVAGLETVTTNGRTHSKLAEGGRLRYIEPARFSYTYAGHNFGYCHCETTFIHHIDYLLHGGEEV